MVSGTEQQETVAPPDPEIESLPDSTYRVTDADLEPGDIITDPMHSVASVEGQTLRLRLLETLWQYVGTPIMRLSFHNWYGLRCRLLRLFGAEIHPTARIRPSVRISHPWRLSVGANTAVGDDAILFCRGPIRIGRRCTISQYVHLCSATYDYHDRCMPMMTEPIVVEDDAWIAADVFIGPGVTIGADTVVGSRSTVLHDLPSRSICVGDSARRIAEREIRYGASPGQEDESE